jgi:hypothetical protein
MDMVEITIMKLCHGGCLCGMVRYQVKLDLGQIISCSCSYCSKRGLLLAFVSDDQFSLVSDDTEITDYSAVSTSLEHKFCRTCGAEVFARRKRQNGSRMIAINVRSLDGIDISALTIVRGNCNGY